MTNNDVPIVESDLLAMSDAEWDRAVREAAVIAPLAAQDVVGYRAATEAATEVGVSCRQIYILIERSRRGSGKAAAAARLSAYARETAKTARRVRVAGNGCGNADR